MIDIKKYMTVKDVADKLDITEEWVRDLIARKEIRATKIGQWRIMTKDLEIFIKNRSNIK